MKDRFEMAPQRCQKPGGGEPWKFNFQGQFQTCTNFDRKLKGPPICGDQFRCLQPYTEAM